ncbi:rolling circle replication-associated protein [Riemerella columbipharyngis]|uniref:Replication-associated protein ORF2/G2P domain-containing protein n=1 Tax=Riemerella columbipharyngis TaxID=1071918 RepID=A0A1G6ZF55_9FLAO|nr:hypothetical protein [Riemerella columbipharyngis]SDE00939.1 hypothetical protein SAMN05421544_10254 [Riemerella columbipharyngis]SDE01248.1 hypothetical protein SAMN05421544_10264 [Riemerella columbipharyngis]
MFYKLSRLGIAEIRTQSKNSQHGGSSLFKSWKGLLIKKEASKSKDIIKKMESDAMKKIEKDNQKKEYQLRKFKIRNKIMNFFSLKSSRKFCAFYTVTFPLNIPDEIAYKLLNTWLTRCRKLQGLKSYLWVAERQKNGTLHFHLITNNYMNIREVNEYMKIALKNAKKKDLLYCEDKVLEKYNGVDVDNLYHSKRHKKKNKRLSKIEAQRKLMYYLSKYVTKNETKSKKLPWHCSRDISALFISVNYSEYSENEIFKLVSDNPEAVKSFHNEYFSFHYFLFTPEEKYFVSLNEINEKVYQYYNQN